MSKLLRSGREIVVNGPSDKHHKSKTKVEIYRSIKYLPRHLLIGLFAKSEVTKGLPVFGARELEALRDLWLAWLDRTPRYAFLSYVDAYYAFLDDASKGGLLPGEETENPSIAVLERALNRQKPA